MCHFNLTRWITVLNLNCEITGVLSFPTRLVLKIVRRRWRQWWRIGSDHRREEEWRNKANASLYSDCCCRIYVPALSICKARRVRPVWLSGQTKPEIHVGLWTNLARLLSDEVKDRTIRILTFFINENKIDILQREVGHPSNSCWLSVNSGIKNELSQYLTCSKIWGKKWKNSNCFSYIHFRLLPASTTVDFFFFNSTTVDLVSGGFIYLQMDLLGDG